MKLDNFMVKVGYRNPQEFTRDNSTTGINMAKAAINTQTRSHMKANTSITEDKV